MKKLVNAVQTGSCTTVALYNLGEEYEVRVSGNTVHKVWLIEKNRFGTRAEANAYFREMVVKYKDRKND